MPPSLALLLWLILFVLLLRYDPARESSSAALWVPTVWMFIIGTRLPAQWLSGQVGQAAEALQDGNPIDRTVNLALIVLSISILLFRSFRWSEFATRNACLITFLCFALLSVSWSDFPFVAAKRWFKDCGNYLVILVVASDRQPVEAVQVLLRRLCYLLLPLSVILIKYFPGISRAYDPWTGAVQIVGPSTGKNLLGVIALLGGIFFFWDMIVRWPQRRQRQAKLTILVGIAFLAMTLWVMNLANSRTAEVCWLVGCIVIFSAHTKASKRYPGVLQAVLPIAFCIYLVLALGFGMSGDMAQAVGKDATLTDRTKIWAFVLSMHTNPILGTGYETFWLGPRIEAFWANAGLGRINEAHNGYLEVYLQLGSIGVALLCGFLIASYGDICKGLIRGVRLASLGMGLWIVLLFYSWTEAGFRSNLVWLSFLLVASALSGRSLRNIQKSALLRKGGSIEPGWKYSLGKEKTADIKWFNSIKA